MLDHSFSSWPSYSEDEIEAVADVLRSGQVNYWTGEHCKAFEREFANWCGTKHAVALANGTLALEAALRALEIGPGDEVIVPSRTFVATASSVVSVGARPVFADVDINSGNLSATSIEQVIAPATKAIICVHLAGWPCDMDPILALAERHGLWVIEDCAQAHGASYKGQSVGSIGHIGAWSFCQDKIMSTGGEGGMVTTNDETLWSRVWSLKDHGKSYAAVHESKHSSGFSWLHESFGSNLRMTEMQAVIGRMQLSRMTSWSKKRLNNANIIWNAARQHAALRVPVVPDHITHAAYKCYVFVRVEQLRDGWDRDRIMDEIIKRGVPCFSGSCAEVYLEKAFGNTDFRPKERLSVAKELGETSLAFLVHPTMTEADMLKTAESVSTVIIEGSSK